MSSSVHIDNKKKEFLDLDSGTRDGLDDTRVTARKEYSINFTEQDNKFFLVLHYNGMYNYIFANGVEVYKFKANNSRLYRYVYNFSVAHDNIKVDDVLDIHKYLMINTK